jgi:hypothetical protein
MPKIETFRFCDIIIPGSNGCGGAYCYKTYISYPIISCDIVFQKGQILFPGFALFIFMIYIIGKNWLQVGLLARKYIF